jgi:hypothetical protein
MAPPSAVIGAMTWKAGVAMGDLPKKCHGNIEILGKMER